MEEATHLKRNQFGTRSAIIFALVYTAPVMSLAGALQVMAGKVGYGVPMGMMVGALAMIATALSLMEMVKTKPHTAGSIGAFGKEALGPVWGFVPGWMILVINLNIIFPAPICAVYLHSTLEGFFGWSPPAWVMVIGIVSVAAYIRGLRLLTSARPACITAGSSVQRIRGRVLVEATRCTARLKIAGSPETDRIAIAFSTSVLPM